MAEVMVRDGRWTFDGELVRIVPGRDRRVHPLRRALGELVVPLTAIAGVAYEPGRKAGQLRLRLRDWADPFLQVAGGKLSHDADPYRLAIDRHTIGAAEYLVDEVHNALVIEQVPPGPSDRYLLDGPAVPLAATAGDGSASFDGSRIRIEWTEWAEDVKKSADWQEIALEDVVGIEWAPISGLTYGFLRFRVTGVPTVDPKHDPNCLTWGILRKNKWGSFGSPRTRTKIAGGTTSLLAAAVVVRLPHPSAGPVDAASPALTARDTESASGGDHDALLRRLRELGDLHRDGVLTDEEFAAAKRALLREY
ncbi:MAG TPA: DUF4429 domain-containing protein [Jiangellaceae bacterium]